MQIASTPPTLLTYLTTAINGEFTAIHFYEELAKLAPNEETERRILEIRQDEMRHFEAFAHAYMSLTGLPPSPEITADMPTSFKAGVRHSFLDEQETTEFYHRAARESQIAYVSHLFNTASMDEQNHAVWFLYFLTS